MNIAARQGFQFKNTNKVTKNRVVLAPLTHNMSAINGDLSTEEIHWLEKCATGGFGMIITAATMVSSTGRSWLGQPGLLNDKQKEQFAHLAKITKRYNALGIVQLHHGGIRTEQNLAGTMPVGPSVYAPDQIRPSGARQLETSEIHQVIDDFCSAAKRAYDSGMDGVEIHAAFNFLLSNFSNPRLNKRQDKWGGSFKNRNRLLTQIILKIRAQLPRNFIIGVRLSPENYAHFQGIDINEQIQLANQLTELDIDYIHLSLHNVFKMPDHLPGSQEPLLSWIKQKLNPNVPLIVAGKIYDQSRADKAISLGADFVALGTAAIGNPDWVNKVNAGSTLADAPYSKTLLENIGFTSQSINYLSTINGLVAA